jgi:hypothetical protein
MKGRLLFTDDQKLQLRSENGEDENITVSISEATIEIQDHLSATVNVLPQNKHREISIEPGRGNDIIHIVSKGKLSTPFSVFIDAKGGHKLIVGSNDPMLQLQVNHANEEDLVLPDDDPETYERYAGKIQQWNESNRKEDGYFKGIKRKVVYFFGRDLQFKRPFAVEEKFKKWFPLINLGQTDIFLPGCSYYTSSEHLSNLEAIAKQGDILLRYQDGYPFDKYFVGTWQHAGLYYKKGKVIDAMGNGTYLRTIEQFGEADGIVLLRIKYLSDEQARRALCYAFEQIGKSYSVDFDDNTSEQYCSGLIINAYKYAGVLHSSYRKGGAIHPDDLLKLDDAEILWTNRPKLLKLSLKNLN